MTSPMSTLAGRTIAIPETRELDVFAGLLERRGASVVRCPLVAILDAPDPKPVIRFVERMVAREFDDLILLTGEGLRRIVSCIERHSPGLRRPFIDALATVRKITRGPKPARALRELELQTDLAAVMPTTDGIIEALTKHDLHERRIAVQLYGVDPNKKLVDWLEHSGARVSTVAPYIYADSSKDEAVHSLAGAMLEQKIDAIAFTSMQQVQRYFDVLGETLARSSMQRTRVAAIGPIVADVLSKRGVNVEFVPEDAFFLKPLTRALEERLGPKPE
jgi:uroporphyrinogen-III synthase